MTPFHRNPMLASRFHVPDSSMEFNNFVGSQKVLNFPHFSAPYDVSSASASAQFREKDTTNLSQSETRECSAITVGSSLFRSYHFSQDPDFSRTSSNGAWSVRDCVQRKIPRCHKGKSEMVEPTLTSSSGGSDGNNGRTCSLSTRHHGQKRKGTGAEVSEEQSEDTELKSANGNKASRRAGSSRSNRAAEVHNLSERRRRDKINEKMKALQELIPNSNKTDKASMLEEAIEYMKSLQLQLQVMWMGAGIAPLMFPGIQQYMSQMNMGMASPSLPSIQNPMQLPRLPHDHSIPVAQIPNHAVMCQNLYQNNMQNKCLSEKDTHYVDYNHFMQSTTQQVNVFRHGSQAAQHAQTMIAPNNSSGPMSGAANIDNAASGKIGSSTFN